MKHRKAVKDMKENEEMNGMTNEQFRAALEAIKAFAEETRDIEKTIRVIERMQGKEKEPTSGTK